MNREPHNPVPTPNTSEDAPVLIEFQKVSKAFGDKVILDAVDLSIREGEVTTIIGKSGAGKSVCLKHIVGLHKPDSGRILYRGKCLDDMTREERRAFKRSYSYMFQNNALFDSMTVYENVALPLKERGGVARSEIARRVDARLEQLELSEARSKYPSQISGGMQKRVALARALVGDPTMILFDEPTTGLDPIRKNAVLSMIAHYQRQFGFTAVVVSHDIPDIFYISSRVAILYDAKFIFQGPPAELEQLNHPVVDEFANSLKSLKDELTGLDTRRQFERRYQEEFPRMGAGQERGSIMLFSIDNLGAVDEHVGHIAAHRIIQSLAAAIDRLVGAAGYSARFSPDEILTVLPDVRAEDAESLMAEVGRAMNESDVVQPGSYPRVCYSFAVRGAVVPSTPDTELKTLAENAKNRQQVLATLQCG